MIPTKEEWEKALLERHGRKLQDAFSSATVAICGLGGLGSNIAFFLVRAGLVNLYLLILIVWILLISIVSNTRHRR